MKTLFASITDLSVMASWLIGAVIIVRFLLKKAPASWRGLLWVLVGIRLLCPVSFESNLSLVPERSTVKIVEFEEQEIPMMNGTESEVTMENSKVEVPEVTTPITEEPTVKKSFDYTALFSWIWAVGMAGMLVHAAISYRKIRRKADVSIQHEKRVWICDDIQTPFILGIIGPRIYIPSTMDPETMQYVLAHENAHIQRKDHWWKPLGYLILTVYWFNPLVWLAYILMCRDIELACDEKVVVKLDAAQKKAYSSALLSCSIPRKMIAACPVAFGEVGVKMRIRSILNYKKPAFWLVVVMILVVIGVGVFFGTKPKESSYDVLDLSHFVLEDGSHGWKEIHMCSSVEDVEKELNIHFDEPFEDFEGTTVYAPLEIQYNEYPVNVFFIFQNEKLDEIHFEFEMDTDVNSCYNELYRQMKSIYGEHNFENSYSNGSENPAYGWIGDVYVDDAVYTQMDMSIVDESYVQIRILVVPDFAAESVKEHPEDALLDLDTLLLEDGSYGWMGIAMNNTKEEVEAALGMELGEPAEETEDAVYYDPLHIDFSTSNGSAVFVFKEERLAEIRFDFRLQELDDLYPEEVFNVLDEELTAIYGECHYQSQRFAERNQIYGWLSDTTVGEGLLTRLQIEEDGTTTRLSVRAVPDRYTKIAQEPYQDEMGHNFSKYFDLDVETVRSMLKDQGIEMRLEYDTWIVDEEIEGHKCRTALDFYSLKEGSDPILINYSKSFEKEEVVDWEFIVKVYDYLVKKLGRPEQIENYSYMRYGLVQYDNHVEYNRMHFQEMIDNKRMTFTVSWNDDWEYSHSSDDMQLWNGTLTYNIGSPNVHEYVLRKKWK